MLDGLELPPVARLHLQAGTPGHEDLGRMIAFDLDELPDAMTQRGLDSFLLDGVASIYDPDAHYNYVVEIKGALAGRYGPLG